MAHITVNGANFYYEVHGDGIQSIVLVSGYSAGGNSWLPLVLALAKHFKVIFFDNRACGQTHDDNRELSVELMADDTIALCQALKLHKPHIRTLNGGNYCSGNCS